MKSMYLIGGAIIIVLLGIILGSTRGETPTPTPGSAETETQTTTPDEAPTAESMGMTAEEHAAMMGESTQGTDVGMEMPIMDDMPMGQPGAMKMFDISGENFVFDVKEIRVKEGDTVMIHFMSADGFHDLVIDEFNVQTEKIRTGGMSMVTFVADKKGTFEYYCSVGSHRASGMVGKLIVE